MLNLRGSAAHVCLFNPQVRLLNPKFGGQTPSYPFCFPTSSFLLAKPQSWLVKGALNPT